MLSIITYSVDPADNTLPRITDFFFAPSVAGSAGMLYSSTRYSGVLASWSLAGPALKAFDSTSLLRPDAAGAVAQIGAMQIGSNSYLLTGGGRGGEMMLRALNPDGSFGLITNLGYLTQFSGDLIGLQAVSLANGTTAVYGGILNKSGIGRLSFDQGAHVTATGLTADTNTTYADRVVALAQATVDGQTYLFSASTETYFTAPGITAWAVGATGSLTASANIDAATGLWIATPTALSVAHLGPQTFLIAAAAGTGSLTVMEVGSGGSLRVASHVLDTLDSRFAGVTALASLDLGGRSYVVAGGSDDGITVFQLLPGGRLLALATLADTDQIGLAKISALDMRAAGDGFDIFVASSSELGITQLHYALGAQGLVQHAANTGGSLQGGGGEDTLFGWGGNDVIDGGAGNDIIADGGGSDLMRGGLGADIFLLSADGAADTIADFTPGQDRLDLSAWPMLRNLGQLQITSTATGAVIRFGDETLTLLSASGQPIHAAELNWSDLYNLDQIWMDTGAPIDPLFSTAPPDDILGTEAGDVLQAVGSGVQVFGLAGNDSITSDVGYATLFGGAGDDRYFVFTATDQLRETAGEGFDRAFAAVDYSLAAGQEIELLGAIDGGATDALNLTGNELSQTLIGNAGANTLNTGGGGADILRGGAGDDTYFVYNSNDRVYEAAGQGFDQIFTYAHFALVAFQDVEVLSVADTAATTALNLSGNSYSQTLIGNAGSNRLSSGLGSPDTLIGGAGDDIYYVYNALDQVREEIDQGFDRVFTALNYTLTAGQSIEVLGAMSAAATTPLNLTGNALAQTIIGNAGANILRSGAGAADILIGSAGNDTYYVSNAGDQVLESAGNGLDRVFAAVNYILTAGQEVELLGAVSAASTDPLTLTGNEKSQTIIGNAGDNVLSSGGGAADTMLGGGGNDTYYVFNPYDRVNESLGAGNDHVFTTVTYALTAGQEIEMLSAANLASTAPLYLFGNAFSQTIIGNAGQNRLSSGEGAPDILIGGLGHDTYYVYNIGDQTIEDLSGGFDKVFSAVNYRLTAGQSIELLGAISAVATDPLQLTGNELSQTIIGNAGDNILNTGGGAADVLRGSLGNDSYYVYNIYDRVYENRGEGIDHIFTTVNYAVAPNQEVEFLSVADPNSTFTVNMSGNSFSQIITGNSGNNTISTGGGSADTLIGGAGNDIYYLYNSADQVEETLGNGYDRIFTAVSYALAQGQDIEMLSATSGPATAQINLFGNELSQRIIGNAGSNIIDGGGGSDILTGGAGADSFIFNSPPTNNDVVTITDFEPSIDVLMLNTNSFNGLQIGSLSTAQFEANSTGEATSETVRFSYDTATGKLWYDPDGNGQASPFHFADLSPELALSNADFLVFS